MKYNDVNDNNFQFHFHANTWNWIQLQFHQSQYLHYNSICRNIATSITTTTTLVTFGYYFPFGINSFAASLTNRFDCKICFDCIIVYLGFWGCKSSFPQFPYLCQCNFWQFVVVIWQPKDLVSCIHIKDTLENIRARTNYTNPRLFHRMLLAIAVWKHLPVSHADYPLEICNKQIEWLKLEKIPRKEISLILWWLFLHPSNNIISLLLYPA